MVKDAVPCKNIALVYFRSPDPELFVEFTPQLNGVSDSIHGSNLRRIGNDISEEQPPEQMFLDDFRAFKHAEFDPPKRLVVGGKHSQWQIPIDNVLQIDELDILDKQGKIRIILALIVNAPRNGSGSNRRIQDVKISIYRHDITELGSPLFFSVLDSRTGPAAYAARTFCR